MAKLESREIALLCVRYALEKKAYDLLLLDVNTDSSLADYFLICTGRSDTQVQAIAGSIEQNVGSSAAARSRAKAMRQASGF